MVQAYSLSSEEGIALMCLAEALLRIPDAQTADALIRDKLAQGDWRSHAALTDSLFVNAASWGLVITGRIVAPRRRHRRARARAGRLARPRSASP